MIISVFSPAWFFIAVLAVLLIIFLGRSLRNRERKVRLDVLEKLSILTCIFWVIYKTVLAFDTDYAFVLTNELPLHLCNIGSILSIFAARKDSRSLQSFMYFCSTIGALFACLTPDPFFVGVPLYTPRCIGYWLYHVMVFVLPIAFVTSGIYKPAVKDIPRALLLLLGIGFLIFAVNLLLRATIYQDANYCFSFGIPGNPLTELLLRYIPIPVIYMLPMLLIVGLVNVLMALPAIFMN